MNYPKKKPNPTDTHVGLRVRQRRMMVGMSQTELGDACGGVTFQQVQKYEKGMNRIGSSRLQQIATALKVPVSFFFEGLPQPGGSPADYNASQAFLSDRAGLDIVQAWPRLSPALRGTLAAFIKSAAEARG